jgi:hypothetical protein
MFVLLVTYLLTCGPYDNRMFRLLAAPSIPDTETTGVRDQCLSPVLSSPQAPTHKTVGLTWYPLSLYQG